MALTANAHRLYEMGDIRELPVASAEHIYWNAAVGLNGGYARALNAGDIFLGFAEAEVDNSAGGNGALNVRIIRKGIVELPVTGVDGNDDIGKAVYASDDGTYTLTASTNSPIGKVDSHVSGTKCMVAFAAHHALAALTDSSGGTADGTISAVGATNGGDVSGTINNNFKELNNQINLILAYLGK